MAKYRKKPIVIDAYQWSEEGPLTNMADSRHNSADWPEWLRGAQNQAADTPGAFFRHHDADDGTEALLIKTLEGAHHVSDGDFIIRGIKGELYPCKPDIFAATYEEAA